MGADLFLRGIRVNNGGNSVCIYIYNFLELHWPFCDSKSYYFFFISAFSAGIVGGIFLVSFEGPGLSSEDKEEFRRVCGFPTTIWNY